MTERKELIARLRDATEGPRMLINEAADMLEADAPAIPKTWHLVGYYHKAESADECDFYFKDVINDDCPDCHPCYADTAALEKPAPAVPQEPVRNDMSIQLLERLIKTLTNLGYATPEGGIEAFNADLPTQLYHLCFGVDRVLSALKTAVPQEPVAWQYRGRPAVNREWGEWHTVGHKPKGPECTRFMMRPLFAAPPPQPRLTDAEILTLWAQTYVERGTSGIEFARVIEAKVRGEA